MKETDGPMITYEMILEMTNSIYFQRGEEYQSWGMVRQGWIIDNGIKAKVAGNYKPYYLVQITLSDTMKLRGSCTCPVGFGCKHSVAACLQYLYKPKIFLRISILNIFWVYSSCDSLFPRVNILIHTLDIYFFAEEGEKLPHISFLNKGTVQREV